MKAAIARQTVPAPDGSAPGTPPTRPLAGLTTRSAEDFAIASIDACAVLGEVLTFYAERIANEGYLRTATERRSVLELAREIGYELNPGVAGSAYLASPRAEPFVPPGGPATPQPPKPQPALPAQPVSLPSPTMVRIPAGSKVQSVPGQGQLPQTFETTADLVA